MNITTILPVKAFDEKLMDACLKSIANQNPITAKLLIGCLQGEDTNIKKLLPDDLKNITEFVVDTYENFEDCVNKLAKKVRTKYFSIIAFDDEFSSIWFKNVTQYEKYNNDVSVFIPFIYETNKDQLPLGITNEPVWAKGFSDEMGYIDSGVLDRYKKFSIYGAVFNKNIFNEIGGFKTNMEVVSFHELLLRYTYHGHKVMVIPKIGYMHLNTRDGSRFDILRKTLKKEDVKNYFEIAKKESYFKVQRQIEINK